MWITFPDPFPKQRSAKNRLTHPTFLRMYQRFLAPGGALYFKTDAHDLFIWSLEQLVARFLEQGAHVCSDAPGGEVRDVLTADLH